MCVNMCVCVCVCVRVPIGEDANYHCYYVEKQFSEYV